MASIVVLTHERDHFRSRGYTLEALFAPWNAAGHVVRVHAGPHRPPPGDLAILHVDTTVVDEAYLEVARHYPIVVNGAVTDISKRRFSRQIVHRGSAYAGPVIVKTDLNSFGRPEAFHRSVRARWRALRLGPVRSFAQRLRHATGRDPRYRIYAHPSDVPAGVWDDPSLVVEQFLPERDERGYYLRSWVFLGDRGRCTRLLGPHPVVKARDVVERVPAPIPDELRAWRDELGFDYGKFDFVIHEGRPVLFDVNPTPGLFVAFSAAVRAANAELARGIDTWLQPAAARARSTTVGQRSPSS
jgi:hypothetical protein